MKHTILFLSFLILLSVKTLNAYVATITASKGDAKILRLNEKLEAKTGSKLKVKDNILTGDNTKVQLIFKDETIVSIGKNSNFSISKYLYEENSEPVARFGMIVGAMRIITGKIGKIAPQKFSVTTKTATIGIRGTNFTVVANKSGELEAFCTYGEISVTLNKTEHSVAQGFYLHLDSQNKIGVKEFSAEKLQNMRKTNFGVTSYSGQELSRGTSIVQRENNQHLNVTINDNTALVAQDIGDTTKDTFLNSQTLSTTIADYTMQHALYYGNYSTYENSSVNLPNNGDVKLSINFAQDSALLELGSFDNESPSTSYIFSDVNSNHVEGVQENGEGKASILFFGPTGNIVNGAFTYSEDPKGQGSKDAKGTYSAKTFETLH